MASRQQLNPPNDGKGKAKAGPLSGDDNEGDSLISRIANSTVGLASSMLSGTPSSSVLTNATSEKGSSSTAPGSTTHHAENSEHVRPDIAAGPQPSQAFRNSQAQGHATAQEAAFSDFLDSTPAFQPSTAELQTATTAQTDTFSQRHDTHAYPSAAEMAQHDGQPVVSLLQDTTAHLPDTLTDDPLTPSEEESLRKALFGPAQEDPVDWDHALNFIPFDLRMGEALRNNEWQAWLHQWEDVLIRYDDEVWGGLSDLVDEARGEMMGLAQTPEDEVPSMPALRRLRAILGHLQG